MEDLPGICRSERAKLRGLRSQLLNSRVGVLVNQSRTSSYLVDVVEFDVVQPHSREGCATDLMGQIRPRSKTMDSTAGKVLLTYCPTDTYERLPAPERDLALRHVDRGIADVASELTAAWK